MKNLIDKLTSLISASERIVAFTGAGISTESGIPDFRSPTGIWSKFRPISYNEFVSSESARRESWRRKSILNEELKKATPNRGHRGVFQLCKQGKLSTVITQNIDGLHQSSGIEDEKIIEIHGNATIAKCLECDQEFPLEPILARFKQTQEPPICEYCDGLVKSATISFGQKMPEMKMKQAEAQAKSCDLFLVLGSSLVVYPAAQLPLIAKGEGAHLVIVNLEKTSHDQLSDLVIHDQIGSVLGKALDIS